MFDAEINYVAVLVATVVYMALGALWYSPVLFVKPWMKALGRTQQSEEARGNSNNFAVALLVSGLMALLIAYVLAHFIYYVGAASVGEGIQTGLFAGVGFVLTTNVTNMMFAGTSRTLLAIDAGYPLVGLIIMGGILGAWQ